MICGRQNKGVLVFCVVSLFMVVLYEPLTKYIHPAFKYMDEFLAVCLVLSSLLHVSVTKETVLFSFEKQITLALLVIFLIGTVPYALGNPPNGMMAYLTDLIIFYKIFAVYFSVRILYRNWNMVQWERTVVAWVSLIILLLACLVVLDKIFVFIPHKDIRFGFYNEELFFGHSSRYAFFFQFAFIVLLPYLVKRNRLFLILVLFLGGLSLRFKYFGFLPFAFLFMFGKGMVNTLKYNYIRTLLVLALISGTTLFAFWGHVKQNFLSEGYARAQLTRKSFQIARDHFPVGSGFGTYGSHASGKYYSKIYYTYRLNTMYGLSKNDARFVADTFWPMVLGQFGYAGLLAYCFIMLCFFRLLIEHLKTSDDELTYFNISAILLLLCLIIDSSSDSILTHNRAVMAFFYIGLVVNMNNRKAYSMGEQAAVENSIDQ